MGTIHGKAASLTWEISQRKTYKINEKLSNKVKSLAILVYKTRNMGQSKEENDWYTNDWGRGKNKHIIIFLNFMIT